ncbi:helix-turn-helix domain-containing protein [Candidatus Enterococcus murrayae]|uniref:Helix-turn-helix domain-containing protein n=1 Tax=Candidatus Enterococcus murrayae TaxID=2815321 RepID=A0ABS3HD07_9ENTE|nr:helix-turn-helix domain-containing protein [Enterococcus sp. MJM16]MBO0451341.1 helix-turn-helix domain-containing protein [Enterococcus sp. MJM16]
MKSILLSDESKKKLEIFFEMNKLEDGRYPISSVIKLFRFSKNTVYQLLEKIAADLESLFGYELFDKNGKIIWSKKAFDMNRYNQFLLRKSLPYNFILFILLHPGKTLDDFCSANFISTSTIRRTLQPFLTFLKKFEIKINLSSMRLEGNEYEIRMMFHTILWACSLGQGILEVEEVTQKEAAVLKQLGIADCSYINNDDILTILLIAKLRIQGGFPEKSSLPVDDFIPSKTINILTDYLSNFVPSNTYLETEVRSLAFQLYFSNLYYHKDDVRVKDLSSYYLEKKGDGKFIPIIDRLFKRVDLKVQQDTMLPLVNLISIFFSFSLNHRPLPWMKEFSNYEVLFPNFTPRRSCLWKPFSRKFQPRKDLSGFLIILTSSINTFTMSYRLM